MPAKLIVADGNKRTAWAAAWTFLWINAIELATDFDTDAAECLVIDVAMHDCDPTDLVERLAEFVEQGQDG